MDKTRGPLVVNFYGGPGSGKSRTAALTFANLKNLGYKVELIQEYAKDVTYGENFKQLSNQIYIFAKQHNRMWRVKDHVDIIVMDSPLLMSIVYNKQSSILDQLVAEQYYACNNLDILLKRVNPYQTSGRSQTEPEAKALDLDTREVLRRHNFDYDCVNGNEESIGEILQLIKERLKD